MSNKYFSAYSETSDPEALLKWLADEQTQELMQFIMADNQQPIRLDSDGQLLLHYSLFLYYVFRFNTVKYLEYIDMLDEEYGGLFNILKNM